MTSRNADHAGELAAGLGAVALPFADRETRLADFDILVCATAAPETVLSQAAVVGAMRRRRARPLLLLDLALPRDVEAAAGGLDNVFLYNLDDLAKIADENLRLRQAEIARCRALLEHRAAALWADLERRRDGPAPSSPASPAA